MGSALSLNECNFHQLSVAGRRLLFHIPSSALFEADENTEAVISVLREGGPQSPERLEQRLSGRLDAACLEETVGDLRRLGIVSPGKLRRRTHRARWKPFR